MKFLKYYLFSLLSLLILNVQSQDVKFIVESGTVEMNNEITLDITTENFTNIHTMQFGFGWDSLNLEFVSIQDFNSDLTINMGLFGVPPNIRKDRISFSWAGNSAKTVDDGTVLFSITFKAIGPEGSVNPVEIVGFPGVIEVVQNSNAITPVLVNGTVTIQGNGGGSDDLEIIMPTENVNKNAEICIPITVRNFEMIGAVNFGLFYDSNVLEFQRTQAYNLPGLDVSSFNLYEPGVLAMSYSSTLGTTVDDNTVIFEVCFKAIGNDGDMSSLTLGDIVRPGTTLKMEAVRIGGIEVDINVTEGKITIGDISNLPFGLKITPPILSNSGEYCVPIKVQGNDQLDDATFDIKWNENQFVYSETRNFIAPAATLNESNVSQGILSVLWNSISGQAINLNQGDTFMEICFTVSDCQDGEDIIFAEENVDYSFSKNGVDVVTELIDGTVNCAEYSVTAKTNNASCDNVCDGSISLAITGWDIQTIQWSEPTFPSDANVNDVCPGTYSVTVTYTNGREVTNSNITVSSSPSLNLVVDSVFAAVNTNTGAIYTTTTGGDNNYTYNYTPGNLNVEDPTDLAAGTYFIQVVDGNGCEALDTVVILDVSAEIKDVKCPDDTDGSVRINVSGGSGDYSYKWSCSSNTSNIIENLPSGACLGEVTDNSTGVLNYIPITIGAPSPIIITLVSADAGSIDIDVTGGTPSYTYKWSNGATTQDIDNVDDGIYSVIVTDANGCSERLSNIALGDVDDVTEVTSLTEFNNFGVSCNGDCNGYIDIVIRNIEEAEISWEDGSDQFSRSDLCPGTYEYTVTDGSGVVVKTNTINLTEPDLLSIDDINTQCSLGNNGSATISVEGGAEEYQYSINGTDYQTSNKIEDLDTDDYTVYIRDANGCEFSDKFTIEACEDADCLEAIPVITPNGDGKNDNFIISCIDDYTATLEVYTKWGEKVFEMNNYDNSWGGTDMDGDILDEDTYLWVLIIKNNSGNRIEKGAVSLLRSLN